MMKPVLGIAAAVLAAAAFAPDANADSLPYSPPIGPVQYDSFYFNIGGGAEVRNLPTFSFWDRLPGSPAPGFSDDPTVVTGGGTGTVGYVLPDGFGSALGRRTRMEVSLSGATGASDARGDGAVLSGNAVSIDGSTILAAAGAVNDARVRTRYSSIDGAVRLKTDWPLGTMLTLSPSIAFVAGNSVVDINESHTLPIAGVPTPGFIKETLKTRRLGAELAADLTWRVAPRWMLHGGAQAAVEHMRSLLSGRDCQNATAPASSCTGTAYITAATNSDTKVGYRLGGSAGVTYSTGWMYVTLTGNGTWHSDVPGIRNPTSTDTRSASVVYESEWSYGGNLTMTFPLD